MLTYSVDDSGPVNAMIPDHLPPLVSFELHLPGFRGSSRKSSLSLLSLCTQVAASLKMLSLSGWNLISSDLQYIGEHLPFLEELAFWCVVYIAFNIWQC